MLTKAMLQAIYPNGKVALIDGLATASATLLGPSGVAVTRNRLHFFLAQVGHECGGLTLTRESLNYTTAERLMVIWPKRFPTRESALPFVKNEVALGDKVYGGRMGNTAPGDGFKYRGRGLIQITGKDGYSEVGKIAGLDLVADPDLAIAPEQALRVALAFWAWKKLNPICDGGDFVACTIRINGGTVGLDDRRAWLRKVQAKIPFPLTGKPAFKVTTALIRKVQKALEDLGLYTKGVDGTIGDFTRGGLRAFQTRKKLPVTGEIDEATVAALGL